MNPNQNSPPEVPGFFFPIGDFSASLKQELKNVFSEIKRQERDPLAEYIPKEEFLKSFKIKEGLYYKLVNKGQLKIYRIGSKSFLRRSEIDEALKKDLLK